MHFLNSEEEPFSQGTKWTNVSAY